jgi:hypothetical protein
MEIDMYGYGHYMKLTCLPVIDCDAKALGIYEYGQAAWVGVETDQMRI